MAPATGGRRSTNARRARGDATSTKVTLRLPADLVRRAKHHAVDADLDLQDVMAQALALLLARLRRTRER